MEGSMRSVFTLFLALSLLLLAACRQSAQQTPTPDAPTPEFEIEMAVEPSPATTGDAFLVVTLNYPNGAPIDEATIEARGDMNHAGMTPVFGETSDNTNGVYRIPFEWTMGGDWIVTITVTLPDGRRVEQRYEMTINS
jgi:hypothetical protein